MIIGIVAAGYYKYFFSNQAYQWFAITILCITIVETGSSGIYGLGTRAAAGRNLYLEQKASILAAKQKNAGFSRADITDPILLDSAVYYDLKGVGLFSSTIPKSMQDFMNKLGFQTGTNKYKYIGATDITNMMLGVNQILDINTQNPGKLEIKANTFNLGLGFLVDPMIYHWNVKQQNPLEVQNDFVRRVTGSPLYEVKTLTPDKSVLEKSGRYVYQLYVPKDQTADIYINAQNAHSITIDGKVYTEDMNRVFQVDSAGDSRNIKIEVNGGMNVMSGCTAAVYPRQAVENLYKTLQRQQLEVTSSSSRTVNGVVSSDGNRTLFLSIPYDKGWTALVDGKRKNIQKVGDALSGIDMPKGKHRIQLKYVPPGLKTGLLITLCAGMLMAAGIVIENDRKTQINIHSKGFK